MTNEELRGAILKVTYDAQETGALPLQPNQYVQALGLNGQEESTFVQIANAIQYLSEHGYLNAKGIGSLGRRFPHHIVSGITARGVDQVEGRARSASITQNFQIIGTNYGQAVQHGSINVEALHFPSDALRVQLAGRPEVAAVDEIERELRAEKPRVSKLTGAVETLKALHELPAVVNTISEWVSKPEVHHFITTHLMK